MPLDRRWLDPGWVLGESRREIRLISLGIVAIVVLGVIAFLLAAFVSPDFLLPD